jgi:hypothetical protein
MIQSIVLRRLGLVATAAATTTAVSTTTSTATTILTWACFVDVQRPATKILAIHGLDRLLGTVFHLDKAEASRPTRFTIRDHRRRADSAEFAKRIAKVV